MRTRIKIGMTVIIFLLVFIFIYTISLQNTSHKTVAWKNLNLTKVLQDTIKKYDIPGAVMAITLDNGKTLIYKAGYAQLAPKKPIANGQLFFIGSLTKLITVVTIMQLVQNHVITLNDTLAKIAKQYPQSTLNNVVTRHPYLRTITLRELLNHSSGLHAAINSAEFAKLFNQAPLKVWTHQELIDLSLSQTPYFTPGTPGKFHYTSVTYYIAGMVIAAVTHKPAANAIEQLLQQAGLKHTYVPQMNQTIPQSIKSKLAQGYMTPKQPESWTMSMIPTVDKNFSQVQYRNNGNKITLYNLTKLSENHMHSSFPAGGIISSPAQISLFYHKLFNGKLLTAKAVKQITTGIPVKPDLYYGLGLWITHLKSHDDITAYYHGGEMPGYRAIAVYIPRYNIALSIMTNLETSHLDSLTKDLTATILNQILPQ